MTPLLRRPSIWIAASAFSAAVVLALWQTQGLFAAAFGLFALAALAGGGLGRRPAVLAGSLAPA